MGVETKASKAPIQASRDNSIEIFPMIAVDRCATEMRRIATKAPMKTEVLPVVRGCKGGWRPASARMLRCLRVENHMFVGPRLPSYSWPRQPSSL